MNRGCLCQGISASCGSVLSTTHLTGSVLMPTSGRSRPLTLLEAIRNMPSPPAVKIASAHLIKFASKSYFSTVLNSILFFLKQNESRHIVSIGNVLSGNGLFYSGMREKSFL